MTPNKERATNLIFTAIEACEHAHLIDKHWAKVLREDILDTLEAAEQLPAEKYFQEFDSMIRDIARAGRVNQELKA